MQLPTPLVLALPVAVLAGLGVLTAVGSGRRGAGHLVAVLSGLLFPLTWAAWYVRDVRPYARLRG